MTTKEFNKLLQKINSSGEAFTKLYKFYFPKIVRHIYLKYRNASLGEDIAQDFFIKQAKLKHAYIENPTAWVYKGCENIAKDYFAKYTRYVAAGTLDAEATEDNLFEKIFGGEQHERLNMLDAVTRDIFIYKFDYGYKLKEIAEMLNLPYDNVRQKYIRGLKKLKNGGK